MDFDTMAFFEAQKHPEALPLYEALEGRILAEVDDELMGWVREAAAFAAAK